MEDFMQKDNQYVSNGTVDVWINPNKDCSNSELIYPSKSETYSKDEKVNVATSLDNVSVFDVAVYILKRIKECSTMKLHKLLYYCQAWSLVWDEKPLFPQKIEAWVNGPVIRELFNYHKGLYSLSQNDLLIGNDDKLSDEQKQNIDDVLDFYGDKSSQWLIDLTHNEAPWINARKGLASNERGSVEIPLDEMQLYYSSLK